MTLTTDHLHAVLDYNAETGIFTWRIACRGTKAGAKAGSKPNSDGYINICVNHLLYKAHRLAWQHVHGIVPPNQVDHINGDRADNRLCNLRLATNAENSQSRPVNGQGSSGLIGATWRADKSLWASEIMVGGRRHRLGYFDSRELAHVAYLHAKARLHKFQSVPRDITISSEQGAIQ